MKQTWMAQVILKIYQFNPKDSVTDVHSLAVYVKEGAPFAWGYL